MPYKRPKIEAATTDRMRDITPFSGPLPVVELWNRLHLSKSIDTSGLEGRFFGPSAARIRLPSSCPSCEFGRAVSPSTNGVLRV